MQFTRHIRSGLVTTSNLPLEVETCIGLTAVLKQADDELDRPYLAGFEWDKEESWTRLVVHLQKEPGATGGPGGGGKKKKGKKDEE
jgi:hypothetical protein